MNDELTGELIKLAREATIYLARLNAVKEPELPLEYKKEYSNEEYGHIGGPTPPQKLSEDVPVVKRKPGRPRKEVVVEVAAEEAPTVVEKKAPEPEPKITEAEVATQETGLSEEQSAVEVITVAKEFVKFFSKETPDGLSRAREIIASYGCKKVTDLTHPQRVEVILTFKGAMEPVGAK